MDKKDLRILFLGTTSFAVSHLRMLVEEGYNVVGIVTNIDKPAGRGHKIHISPVKEYAQELDIPLFQPERLKDEKFLSEVTALRPTLGIVIAFRMLPKEVWDLPSLGTVNMHGSLLPRWRGAAPINHAIMAGDKKTGVTLFQLTASLDEGNILGKREIPINSKDTFGVLHDKLADEGVILLRERLEDLLQEGVFTKSLAQPEDSQEPYAHKLSKENTRINWEKSAEEIDCFVRGLSPFPTAWTVLYDENETEISTCKIFETELADAATLPSDFEQYPFGSIVPSPKGTIYIATPNGVLSIKALQVPGKKRMDSRSFLNGNQDFKKHHLK